MDVDREMATPFFDSSFLTDKEQELFNGYDLQRDQTLQAAKMLLDNDAYMIWINKQILDCQDILNKSFAFIEAHFSPEIKWIEPVTPVEICIASKWIIIYKSELSPAKDKGYNVAFDSYINFQDKERKAKILSKLHDLIDNKKGKWVALVIRCCIEEGLLKRPRFESVIGEFGEVIGESNYKKYLNESVAPKQAVKNELDRIAKQLAEFLS